MIPYPRYKDANMPWLEHVPEHWEFKRAKLIFKALDARSAEGKEELLSVSAKLGVAPRKNTNVTMFRASSYAGYKLCWPNDLVINSLWAWMAGLGFSKHHGIISTAYSVFRITKPSEFNPDYGHYLLRSSAYSWEFRVRSKGIWRSRYQLLDDAFLTMPLLMPPLDEQRQIARYLNWQTAKINQFTNAKKKLIVLLKEQKQNIINEAVTKGISPNVKMKDSGVETLGELPRHWEIRKLKHIGFFYAGLTGKQGADFHQEQHIFNRPFITFKNVFRNTYIDITKTENVVVNCNKELQTQVEKGDIFFMISSESQDDVGKCALLDTDVGEMYLNSFCKGFRITAKDVLPKFLNYQLSCQSILALISKQGNGFTRINLKQSKLKICIALIPNSLTEQGQIISYIEKETALIDKTITRTEQEIKLMQEYHTRLVSDVVTGKVDVQDIKVPSVDFAEADSMVYNNQALGEDIEDMVAENDE